MILVALGANLPSAYGEPGQTLKAAIAELEKRGVTVLAFSSVWISAPVPASDQPWYRNAVVCVRTQLDASALLKLLHEIERDFGRVRTVRNAARLLDLDLLVYNDDIIDTEEMGLPHPRMHERGFVLKPLQEIASGWVHPVLGRSVEDLIDNLPDDEDIQKAA